MNSLRNSLGVAAVLSAVSCGPKKVNDPVGAVPVDELFEIAGRSFSQAQRIHDLLEDEKSEASSLAVDGEFFGEAFKADGVRAWRFGKKRKEETVIAAIDANSDIPCYMVYVDNYYGPTQFSKAPGKLLVSGFDFSLNAGYDLACVSSNGASACYIGFEGADGIEPYALLGAYPEMLMETVDKACSLASEPTYPVGDYSSRIDR